MTDTWTPVPGADPAVVERFLAKVVEGPETGCWVWMAARNNAGYGTFSVNGRKQMAHRVGYVLFAGSIPEGLVLDHLCRNRACVNPRHLEPKTDRENLMAPGSLAPAKAQAARTHCPRSHELSGRNLIPSKLKEGKRVCLACSRAWTNVRDANRLGNPVPDIVARANAHYNQIRNSERVDQ